jgi:hypothetical protein
MTSELTPFHGTVHRIRIEDHQATRLDPGDYHVLVFPWSEGCGLGFDDLLHEETLGMFHDHAPFAVVSRAAIALRKADEQSVLDAVRRACERIRAARSDATGKGALFMASTAGRLWFDHLLRGGDGDDGELQNSECGTPRMQRADFLKAIRTISPETPGRALLRTFHKGKLSVAELEQWAYSPQAEAELRPEDYLALISVAFDRASIDGRERYELDALVARILDA